MHCTLRCLRATGHNKNVWKRKVQSILHKSPAGLEPLYGRMLEQIEQLPDLDDCEYCIEVFFRTTTLAYRPLHLKEFIFAADASDLIGQYGSFLTIRGKPVCFGTPIRERVSVRQIARSG